MEELQCYEWFASSFIVHSNNVRTKKNVTIQAPLTTVVGHSTHINCHIMKAVMDKIFSLQLSWSADKLQPVGKWTDLITYGQIELQQKDMADCLKLNFPSCTDWFGRALWNPETSSKSLSQLALALLTNQSLHPHRFEKIKAHGCTITSSWSQNDQSFTYITLLKYDFWNQYRLKSVFIFTHHCFASQQH
jgi:hypothetical protein